MTRFLIALALLSSNLLATEPVTFVAYNLKNYLQMDRRVEGEFKRMADKPEKEIAVLVEMIEQTDPDILGLVEIGNEADLSDLQKRLAAAGVDLPHSTWCKGADPFRHVALLSKFPIVSTKHQSELTYVLDKKTLPFGRGILDATVQVTPDYQLRLLGLHLKSKRPVDEGDQALMRRSEAQLLRDYVDQIISAKPETNLLLFGDFNDTRNEPAAPVEAQLQPGGLWAASLEPAEGEDVIFEVIATNEAGIETRVTRVLNQDITGPQIELDFEENEWLGLDGTDRVVLSGRLVSEICGARSLTIDGTQVVINPDGSFRTARDFADGQHSVRIEASDLADNVSVANPFFRVDSRAPTFSGLAAPATRAPERSTATGAVSGASAWAGAWRMAERARAESITVV